MNPLRERRRWALAASWGALYLATPEGQSLGAEEGRLRAFERRHARLPRGPRKVARLGFYDSRRNRELYGQAEARSLKGLKAWMQACYRRNLPFDLFQREELERLSGYDVVVPIEVAVLGEEELAALTAQVRTLAPTKRLAPVQVLAREALPGAYLPLFL